MRVERNKQTHRHADHNTSHHYRGERSNEGAAYALCRCAQLKRITLYGYFLQISLMWNSCCIFRRTVLYYQIWLANQHRLD